MKNFWVRWTLAVLVFFAMFFLLGETANANAPRSDEKAPKTVQFILPRAGVHPCSQIVPQLDFVYKEFELSLPMDGRELNLERLDNLITAVQEQTKPEAKVILLMQLRFLLDMAENGVWPDREAAVMPGLGECFKRYGAPKMVYNEDRPYPATIERKYEWLPKINRIQ